jgi:hypothetical protein
MQILSNLETFEILTRDQIRRLIPGMSEISIRAVNYVLNGLKTDGYILFKEDVYRLSKKGASYVGAEWKKNISQVQHKVMRNDFLIYWKEECGYLDVEFEKEMVIKPTSYGVCDALVNRNMILEVDHEQRWIENKKKLDRYTQLFNRISGFKLYWIVKYESRKEKIEQYEIPGKVYVWDEIK